MTAYIIRRILIALAMLVAASLLGFGIMKSVPGTYYDNLKLNPRVSQDFVDQAMAKAGLDKPWYEQYPIWLGRFLKADLGVSFEYQQPVWSVIRSRVFNTVLMNVVTIVLTWAVAIPLGIYAAVHQYKKSDMALSALSFAGMSMPSFFFALLLLWIFAGMLNILPAGGLKSAGYDELSAMGKVGDIALHLVIPVVVLVVISLAGLQRITRGNMLEVLRQQYITTARAKGLPENRVIYRHALRNAINPLITIFGYSFASLFSGAALLEIVLNYPGMGQMMYHAIMIKDEPLVMAGFMIAAVMLLAGNLLADILLAVADPRISYS